MSFTNRAAGFAAAMFVAVFGTFYAGPSRAWELPLSPATAIESAVATTAAPQAPQVPETIEIVTQVDPAPSAKEPEAPVRRTLGELVAVHSDAKTASAEHECLANAVYFESKGESLHGQLSVAEVVLNRARSGRFPKSICGVVKQRGQFSFVRGGRLPSVPRASAAWRKAVAVAHIALEAVADSPASRALFFHARRVKPGWRGLTRIATVGNHIFYR